MFYDQIHKVNVWLYIVAVKGELTRSLLVLF